VSVIPAQVNLELNNGVVLIGSDAHIWPGPPSTAIRAFIKFCKELEPKVVVLNGDVLDFPRISRYPPMGWLQPPLPHQEIEAAQATLHEIEMECGRNVRKLWCLGNHDVRMDNKLAMNSQEFRGVKGTSLSDHFPNWAQTWSVFINREVIIKHRFRGGANATMQNVLWSGRTIITGHLHSMKVTPFNDYNPDTKYGVDSGCLADPTAEAFNYSENNPKNWRSGFVVLTFSGSKLLMPELVQVWKNNTVQFRGKLIRV
jgi:hypothetical protein